MADRSQPCVVLAQLGTPDAPTAPAVRRYLREFLSDPRVVDLPRWIWLPILYGPILTLRPKKTAALYASIWTDQGSPLMEHSVALTHALRDRLPVRVELGMRYGNPSLRTLLKRLRDEEDGPIVLVPLFPQYAEATTGSVLALAREVLGEAATRLRCVDTYAEDPGYIAAIAQQARAWRAAHGEPDHWLFSFHGIPKSQANRGDPYEAQCAATTARLVAALELAPGTWTQSFQSRFGPAEWLKPYTDLEFERLAREGVETLAVLCPGFAADCLETIDEIAELGQEQFAAAGGGKLHALPCLNSDATWADALAKIVASQLPESRRTP